MAESESSREIISRKEAKARGLKHYFRGVACKRGHLSPQLVSTAQCCECLYIRLKTWRPLNRETARQWDRKWKTENRGRRIEQDRRRYAKNPLKFVEKAKRYYRLNSERVRHRRKQYHYKIYEDEAVRKLAQQRTRQWALDNPERAKASSQNARARRQNATGHHAERDIKRIFRLQRGKCAYCRVSLSDGYHVDHIVPISRCGSNDAANLQLLCAPCNRRKSGRDPIFHARQLGWLL